MSESFGLAVSVTRKSLTADSVIIEGSLMPSGPLDEWKDSLEPIDIMILSDDAITANLEVELEPSGPTAFEASLVLRDPELTQQDPIKLKLMFFHKARCSGSCEVQI